MPDKPNENNGFWDNFKKGYDEQDDKIRADKRATKDRIIEGIVTGASETVFHPLRWLRSLLR